MGVISLVGLLAQHPLFFYSFRFSLSIFLSFNLRHLDFAKMPKRRNAQQLHHRFFPPVTSFLQKKNSTQSIGCGKKFTRRVKRLRSLGFGSR